MCHPDIDDNRYYTIVSVDSCAYSHTILVIQTNKQTVHHNSNVSTKLCAFIYFNI